MDKNSFNLPQISGLGSQGFVPPFEQLPILITQDSGNSDFGAQGCVGGFEKQHQSDDPRGGVETSGGQEQQLIGTLLLDDDDDNDSIFPKAGNFQHTQGTRYPQNTRGQYSMNHKHEGSIQNGIDFGDQDLNPGFGLGLHKQRSTSEKQIGNFSVVNQTASTQNYSHNLQFGVIDPDYKYSNEGIGGRVSKNNIGILDDVEDGLNISQRSSSQYFNNESHIHELNYEQKIFSEGQSFPIGYQNNNNAPLKLQSNQQNQQSSYIQNFNQNSQMASIIKNENYMQGNMLSEDQIKQIHYQNQLAEQRVGQLNSFRVPFEQDISKNQTFIPDQQKYIQMKQNLQYDYNQDYQQHSHKTPNFDQAPNQQQNKNVSNFSESPFQHADDFKSDQSDSYSYGKDINNNLLNNANPFISQTMPPRRQESQQQFGQNQRQGGIEDMIQQQFSNQFFGGINATININNPIIGNTIPIRNPNQQQSNMQGQQFQYQQPQMNKSGQYLDMNQLNSMFQQQLMLDKTQQLQQQQYPAAQTQVYNDPRNPYIVQDQTFIPQRQVQPGLPPKSHSYHPQMQQKHPQVQSNSLGSLQFNNQYSAGPQKLTPFEVAQVNMMRKFSFGSQQSQGSHGHSSQINLNTANQQLMYAQAQQQYYNQGNQIYVNGMMHPNLMMGNNQAPIFERSSNISQRSTSSILSGNLPVKAGIIQPSPFIEDLKVKLNSTKDLTLLDLQAHLAECSLDQQCSRFIQQRLEDAKDEEKQLLFNELMNDSQKLMKDVFGNYVIQKMLEYGNQNQRTMLYQQIKGNMIPLSQDQYGCRVVQKALEVVTTQQQDDLIGEIRPQVQLCVEDPNGNHVIQKIIEQVSSEKVQFIVDAFKGRVYEMSVHQYGCRVIQRMLEHCKEDQIKPILVEVFERVLDLTKDLYGNYVISHVLEHGAQKYKTFVINKMKKRVVQLSIHKFGSNVIEKCLQHSDQKQKDDIIEEIIQVRLMDDETYQSNSQNFTLMDVMKDKYGNFVIQRVLDISNENQRKALIDKILKVALHMKKHRSHARHVFNFLEKNYNVTIVFAEDEEKKGLKKRKSTASKGGHSQNANSQNLRQSNASSNTMDGTNKVSSTTSQNGSKKSKTKNSKKKLNNGGSNTLNQNSNQQQILFQSANNINLNSSSQNELELSLSKKSNGDSLMEFDKADSFLCE